MIIDQKLSEVFDVEVSTPQEVITSDGHVITPEDNQEDYDFQKARNNMHTLLQYGNDGLDFALQIAKDTENPRAIEVFSGLLKNLSDTNMALIDIHEKKKKAKKPTTEQPTGAVQNIQNNQVFVGTTNDLKKFINDLKANS